MDSNIAQSVFSTLLDITPEVLAEIDTIAININSLVSPLMHKKLHKTLRESNLYNVSYFEEIKLILMDAFSKNFINKYQHKKVIFYYKELEADNILKDIYSNFRNRDEIDTKAVLSRMVFKLFVDIARQLASAIPTIKVYTSNRGEHSFIPRFLKMGVNDIGRVLIISRDYMDLLNAMDTSISVYNGRVIYSHLTTLSKNVIDPSSVNPYMLPVVLTLAGNKKLGYTGLPSYGIKKVLKIILDNGIEWWFMDDDKISNTRLRDIVNKTRKYRVLFDIELYEALCKNHNVNIIDAGDGN